ncbi:DUF5802 family protein [Halanaeroarchaeum sulfurireducens]|uniref:Uncharacterized protein n=1 Tax=Halanaeroarchaeum sulfurireducens TaxID=1604004 RepID=A0A0N9N7D9_9EURY|nr:DUF5802 family protein [Halanaeroarchaeum sulfurireducens]ALG82774.1 hypothetical protein HLASA_1895 [Halanaeroarchaeum sulfurireducens]
MFEPFSSGYYLGRLFVEPSHDETATMQRDQHERVNRQLYATDEGIESLDAPLVMKLGEKHLAVHGSSEVPEGTLAVPEETLDAIRIENPPTLSDVLLAKAEHARRLVSYGAV